MKWLQLVLVLGATDFATSQLPPQNDGRPPGPPRRMQKLDVLPDSDVKIEIQGGYRIITSNGIPDHTPGDFPRRGNPNAIRPQRYTFRMPVHPTPLDVPIPLNHQPLGIALNGVLFDPGTNEWWQDDPHLNWNMEAIGGPRNLGLDASNAHVQPSGAYHYHSIPTGLVERLAAHPAADDTKGQHRMLLLGWAADKFPIYGPYAHSNPKDANSPVKKMRSSYQLKSGQRPGLAAIPPGPGGHYDGHYTRDFEYKIGSGDLDECNGRTGVTLECPGGTYYYVLTDNFPSIPRAFRALPDSSFQTHRGGGFPPGGPRGRPPPQ